MKNMFTLVARADGTAAPLAGKTIIADNIQHAYALADTLRRCPTFAADWLGKPYPDMLTADWQCYHTLRHHGQIDERGVLLAATMIACITARNHCRFGGPAPLADFTAATVAEQQHVKQRIVTEKHRQYEATRVETVAETTVKPKRKGGRREATGYNVVNHYERLRSELTQCYHRLLERPTAAEMDAITACYSHDARDMIGAAQRGIMEGIHHGARIHDCYNSGYWYLNRWIARERKGSAKEGSTEYIIAAGGDIVSWGTVVARILTGSEKWVPQEGDGMDAETAARLGAALAEAYELLGPTRQRIVSLLAGGHSLQQIADKMNRNKGTIADHIIAIRKEIAGRIGNGEFEPLLREAEIAAAFGKAVARRACKGKNTQAERARRYRERKKAEAAASNQQ